MNLIEGLEDIIQMLAIKKALGEPIWPAQLKALKDAFEAHDSNDWKKCRASLEVFFENESPDDVWLLAHLASSYCKYRHIMKWISMLNATGLSEESEDSPARIFFVRLVEHIEHQTEQQ